MNNEQLLSLLRTLLQIIGTSVVAHGTLGINGAMWEQITGTVLVIAPTIWSMIAHTQSAQVANVAVMNNPDKIAAFASIPDAAKMASVSDAAKIAAVNAMPKDQVIGVVVAPTASDGVLAAAKNPDMPNVVMTTPAITAAIAAVPPTTTKVTP